MTENRLKVQFDDGPHSRAQLGFIAVANADLTEADMFKMKPHGVGVHFTRVKMEKECTVSSLASMGEALENAIGSLMPGRTDLDVVFANDKAAGRTVIANNIKIRSPRHQRANSIFKRLTHTSKARNSAFFLHFHPCEMHPPHLGVSS